MNRIRKGDEVIVRTGKDKGRRGTVLQVFADDRVLVVVDQFEELFRFRHAHEGSRGEAIAFVKLLLEAAAQDEVPVYVVTTMRAA